jgi:DNA modification methylase
MNNFIVAKNNDESTPLNKATYSVELCEKLLKIYSKVGDLIYDPFMGTGTTGVCCSLIERDFIGSEISEKQVEFSYERIKKM